MGIPSGQRGSFHYLQALLHCLVHSSHAHDTESHLSGVQRSIRRLYDLYTLGKHGHVLKWCVCLYGCECTPVSANVCVCVCVGGGVCMSASLYLEPRTCAGVYCYECARVCTCACVCACAVCWCVYVRIYVCPRMTVRVYAQ